MRTSAILCAVLAGTFGISTLASAQQWRGDRDHDQDRGQRWEQREDRHEHRDERHDWRRYQQPRYESHERYEDRHPHYVYEQPRYGYGHPRYYRGGYVPRQYLRGPYFVSNWNAYPGLYAPPSGYGWVNVDGQYLLVALATGLIANALINGY